MRVILWVALFGLAIAAGLAAWAWRPAVHPIEAPAAETFDPAEVARGANLAALGNCSVCHTAPGGRTFAGGRAVTTPFGVLYSTNITPDLMTGIGQWSRRAFTRALRDGVNNEGEHLYPAFPYDHFTKMSDADVGALYAFLMTRESVRATAPPNELPFPFNVRLLLAAWKALYFRAGRFQPDPSQDALWNRGAYLVEAVAHCGACHTPRNALGAEKGRHVLAGGVVEGWNAYALDRSSPAPVPWNADSLFEYLRHGWHAEHGIARGPMSEVTGSLGTVEERDVRAIATYIAAQMRPQSRDRRKGVTRGLAPSPDSNAQLTAPVEQSPETEQLGAAVYESTCALCHSSRRPLPFGGIDFALSTAINAPNPRNIINVTLHGLHPPEGERGSIMPGFAGALSDEDLAALLGYLRARFSDQPPWPDVSKDIEQAREAKMEEGGSWP
jgi:mono/diheme cytochrome c family protein